MTEPTTTRQPTAVDAVADAHFDAVTSVTFSSTNAYCFGMDNFYINEPAPPNPAPEPATMALLGLGFRSVSMSATALGPVKAMLLSLDAGKLTAVLEEALEDLRPTQTVRQILTDFAAENGIPL